MSGPRDAKRIAVIADTHLPRGSRRLPPRCIDLMAMADAVIHAGDFVTEAALAEIESLGRSLYAVHGNVDEPALRERLPARTEVELEGVRIGVIHDAGPAAGRRERLRAKFPDASCVIFGHTHVPEHVCGDGFQIFNPGSPTERRRATHRAMGIVEVAGGEARFRHLRL
jgi:putative phosphoesterase